MKKLLTAITVFTTLSVTTVAANPGLFSNLMQKTKKQLAKIVIKKQNKINKLKVKVAEKKVIIADLRAQIEELSAVSPQPVCAEGLSLIEESCLVEEQVSLLYQGFNPGTEWNFLTIDFPYSSADRVKYIKVVRGEDVLHKEINLELSEEEPVIGPYLVTSTGEYLTVIQVPGEFQELVSDESAVVSLYLSPSL